MKTSNYLVAIIFFLQTAMSTAAFAETATPTKAAQPASVTMDGETLNPADFGISNTVSQARFEEILKLRDEKPYTSMFVPESACVGKEKELEAYINEMPKTDGNGNATAEKYKGKFNEKELELGDRNFDFEKIMSARFNTQNSPQMNVCLDTFMNMAMGEWFGYFMNRSKEFDCGLEFNRKDPKKPDLEVTTNASAKTDSCDVAYGNETLHSFYSKQMDKLKDIHNSYFKKLDDERAKQTAGMADPSRTQADVCTVPGGCPTPSAEAKNAKAIEKFSSEWCCERISERFEVLGFTTMKDVKPNERVCNELTNKDTDMGYCDGAFCTKTIGECLKNFAMVFLRDFFSSLVNSFDILGWGSQLMTMVKELISNPYEAGKNIVKNMFGFDGEYMGCLNKKSQSQYVCQMIGKFAGSSAGFSAGLGGIIGLARGTFAGVAGKLAKDPTAKIIKPALKDAAKTGAKAAAVGAVWPYFAIRGAFKGTAAVVKGTWRHTPFIAGKAARITVSAVPEAAGRAAQMMGRSFVKRSSDDAIQMGEAMQNAGARRVQRAQEIRSGGTKPSSNATQAGAKYDAVITQSEAAIKTIDDQITALQVQQNKLIEGVRIRNGKPFFPTKQTNKRIEFEGNNAKINELKASKEKANTERGELKKAKDAELKTIQDAEAVKAKKARNNLKGTFLGVGAAGSQYPLNGETSETKDNKSGASGKDGVPVAAPVQGVGTGEGVPKAQPGGKKPDAGATPVEAPPASTPAAPPASGDSGPGNMPEL